MVFTGNNYVYGGGYVRKQGSVNGEKRGNSYDSGNKDFLNNMEEAAEKVREKQEDVSEVINDASKNDKDTSWEALMRVISEQKEEILQKLKNGDTQVRIPIGSMSLTEEEWDRLMDNFDKAQEKILESIREENGEDLPEKRPDTTINGNTVLAPEDTGHEVKSLEDLVSEVGIQGEVEGKTEEEKDLENSINPLIPENKTKTGEAEDENYNKYVK